MTRVRTGGVIANSICLGAGLAFTIAGGAAQAEELPDPLRKVLDAARDAGTEATVAWTMAQAYPQLTDEIFAYAHLDPARAVVDDSPVMAEATEDEIGVVETAAVSEAEPAADEEAAEDEAPRGMAFWRGWAGEGEVGGAMTSGNSETNNIVFALKAEREGRHVSHLIESSFDFTDTSGATTQQRAFAAYQINGEFTERLFAYGRSDYEDDRFSGFEYRLFGGFGLGYDVIDREKLTWTVDGGPGVRYSVLVDGAAKTELSARAASTLNIDLTEFASLSHDFSGIWTDATTTATTTFSFDTKLNSHIATRLSYNLRYETDPPTGRENADNSAKASLLFSF